MKFFAFLALVGMLFSSAARATPADEQFEATAKAYLEQYLQRNPEEATSLGDHRFDAHLTDYSEDAFAKERAAAHDFRTRLGKIDRAQLTGRTRSTPGFCRTRSITNSSNSRSQRNGNRIRWFTTRAWPMASTCAGGARFRAGQDRIANLRRRMEALPAVIVQAKANLQRPPEIDTQTAIEQTQGAISLVREGWRRCSIRRRKKKGNRAVAGEDGRGAGRLQEMAAERSAAALGR